MTSRTGRLAPHIRATALILLLLMALSPGLASAALSTTLVSGSLTAPTGAIWLPGPAGTPGHLWVADGAQGFCRVDSTGLAACATGARVPGQPAFDALSSSVYLPDSALASQGVHRLHYNQTTESIDSDTVLRPTDGLGGNRPSAVALDPTTGALYVGFLHTPNIIRITQPNVGVGDPKVVIGNSQDNKETAGLAFLSVAGVESLIELDASGVGQIPNPAACSSKCIASSLGLGIPGALSIHALDSTTLLVGTATSVLRYDALAAISGLNPTAYASGFLNVSGLAHDAAGDVYALDAPSRVLAAARIWKIAPVGPVALTAPGAPTAVTASAGNASALVSWTAPASDGGSAITSYTVTSTPAGATATVAGTSATLTGLTNGTAYTFAVVGTNSIGSSAASVASNGVTPVAPAPVSTVPGAPTAVIATAGNASASVSWTAPASNGGSAITSYTVTSSPAGASATVAGTSATLSGLTNGTAYTFSVVATNVVGSSAASAPSTSVTPVAPIPVPVLTAPGAPTLVSATAGNASATVSWTAPASDGGSAITSYTVTSIPAGGTTTVAGTSATLTGLTNGTAYTFTVVATNAIGSSGASAASNSVTPVAPITVPGVPTAVSATAGNASATISWTAPASDGGSAITSYSVTSSPAGASATVTGTSATLTGLTNGTAYTFSVVATNAAGAGAASLASNSVTPFTVPGAPTAVSATAGNAQATISWTAPASDGGSAITSYTVSVTSANAATPAAPITATVAAPATTATLTGLTNSTAYTFSVVATNAAGAGAASLALNSVTPFTVPRAPTAVSATAGNAQATISWTAPASDGGSAITSYTVSVTTAAGAAPAAPITATVAAPATTATLTGLTNGTAYTFSVVAHNAAGSGAASLASNSVTPFTVPSAPTAVSATAGNAQATISWTAPLSDGFSPITSYLVASSPTGASATVAAPATSATISGLTNGTAYTFTVTAVNAAGSSSPSLASNSVTPAGPPAPIITQNPSNPTGNPSVSFGFTSSLATATYHCSLVAAGAADSFSACSSPQSYGPLADGAYAFKLTATDPATGDTSSPSVYDFTVNTLTAPTTTAPAAIPAQGVHASTTAVPVEISWSGTACTTNAPSCNVASYHLQRSINGGVFADVALPWATATTIVDSLLPSLSSQATVTTYAYRVQATNAQGQASAFAIGPTFSVAATDNSATVSFSGTWVSSALLGAFGGSVSSSSVGGSFATLPTGFSGTAVALVSTLGPDRGVAEITVDGQVVATVDLFAPTLQAGQIVWSTSGLAPGAHTIKVSQLGTRLVASLGTRVDVDAFIALK